MIKKVFSRWLGERGAKLPLRAAHGHNRNFLIKIIDFFISLLSGLICELFRAEIWG
jgi:hypothetical protein